MHKRLSGRLIRGKWKRVASDGDARDQVSVSSQLIQAETSNLLNFSLLSLFKMKLPTKSKFKATARESTRLLQHKWNSMYEHFPLFSNSSGHITKKTYHENIRHVESTLQKGRILLLRTSLSFFRLFPFFLLPLYLH